MNSLKRLLYILLIFLGVTALLVVVQLLLGNAVNEPAGLRLLQSVQTILLFAVVPALVYLAVHRQNPFTAMNLDRNPGVTNSLIAFAAALASLPATALLAEWNTAMTLPDALAALEATMRMLEATAEFLTNKIVNTNSFGVMCINIVVLAFLPALGEEMFFRGWLQKRLSTRINHHAAIWIIAFVFSAVHLQFYGFLPRLLLGVVLGYVYFYTRSLWSSVIFHFTNNALAVIAAYLNYNDYMQTDNIDITKYAVPSLAMAVVVVVLINMLYLRNRNKTVDQ